MSDKQHVILGAGIAGLGAARAFSEAGESSVIYDRSSEPGGHTRTHRTENGFAFDEGPHVSFTQNERVQEIFSDAVDGDYTKLGSYVDNYYYGAWVKHPAQVNLAALPLDLKTQCVVDFVQALSTEVDEGIENYLEWLIAVYGETFAREFPAVYGEKYHTLPADQMSTVWIGPRLYRPTVEEVIRGALTSATADVHYIPHFRYPAKGGFDRYLRDFIAGATIETDHEVVRVDAEKREVEFASGKVETYSTLTSSIPLVDFIPLVENVPAEVREAAALLACTQCVVVDLGLSHDDFTESTWTYVYDTDQVFTRLSFPHKFAAGNCPEGMGSIQAECYYSDKYKPLDCSPEELIEPTIAGLEAMGLVDRSRLVHQEARFIPYANVIFDLDREKALPVVLDWLRSVDIEPIGRYGLWGYQWTDESFVSGEDAAKTHLARP